MNKLENFLNEQMFTLNRNASLSYEFSGLSTKAFAKHIGCCKLTRSSADIELCGLPGRTNACVPAEKWKTIRDDKRILLSKQ